MLKKVTLEHFKCFLEETEFYLAQITLMYGKNGRGKSTLAQSLLLLAQTIEDKDNVSNLQLTGRYAGLGTFADVVNRQGGMKSFGITLQNDDEVVEMKFEEDPRKPQIAHMSVLNVNGKSRIDETLAPTEPDANGGSSADNEKDGPVAEYIVTTSDIRSLQALKSTSYVSAGRVGPQNSIVRRDSLDEDDMGVHGENVINVLARKGPEFAGKVVRALSYVMDGAAIKVAADDPERIELFLNSKDGEETYKPDNVGFGYSYVLPVIVAACLASNDGLLIMENPEAHLHPAAQSRMMEFLIGIAKEKNLQLIIETHSDHIVNGMRIAMKKGTLDVRDAHILFFSDEDRPVRIITSDRNGALNDNPDDFLDEWTLQMLKLV